MAYRAEIEIAVKGARELSQFQNKLKSTALEVDHLNKFLKNFADQAAGVPRSLSSLNRQLQEASKAFNDVALGTQEAKTAASDYLAATRNLNAGLRERAALLAEVAENERKARLASSGVQERTQYSGPIGPGQASSILGGQSSPIDVRRLVAAKKDQLELERALFDLARKTAEPLNVQLQLQEGLVAGAREALELAEQARRKQQFLAGGPAGGPQGPLVPAGKTGFAVALPLLKIEEASLELARRKQQILDRTAKTRKDLNGLAQNLQRLETDSVVAIKDANREQQKLNDQKEEAIRLAERQLKISKQGALLAGKFSPVGGAENIPGSPAFLAARRRRRKDAIGSGIIGGAFPLLFGQGVGASLGGGLGGAAGGLVGGQFGFGLSLVGTAVGNAVDTFVKNMGDLANSLDDPAKALEALEQAGLKVDASVKAHVESLLEAGKAYEAQQLIFEQINNTLGPAAVGQLNAYQQESEKLNSAYQEISGSIQREMLPALVGLLSMINTLVKAANDLNLGSATKKGLLFNLALFNPALLTSGLTLQQTGTEAGKQAGENVSLSPELQRIEAERVLKNKELADSLRLQVELSNRKLDAAKLNKKTDLDAWLVAQQQIVAQEYKIKNEEIYLRYKREGFDADVRSLLVQQNRNERAAKLLNLLKEYRNIQDSLNRSQAEANKKALADAEAIAKAKASAQINEINATKALFASSIALTRQRDGELAAAKQRLNQLDLERNDQLEVLRIRYEQQAQNSKSLEEHNKLYDIYTLQYRTVVNTYETERLKTQELLNQLEIYGNIARISAAAGFQLSTDLPGAFVPKGAEGILSPGAGLPDFMTGAELARIVEQEVALARVLEKYQEIGQAAQLTSELVTTGFADMVSGTRSAEEVFADFLNSLADMLIKTAQQMIAQYIAIGIARLFATGGSFDPSSLDLSGSQYAAGSLGPLPFGGTGFPGRANGGPVSGGTPYIVGERGPELFIPFQRGQVVSNEDTQQLMGQAQTVSLPFTRTSEKVLMERQERERLAAMQDPGAIDVRYESTVINNTEYVTAEQHRKGLAQAAERGRALTLQALQNSPKTRRKVGI